MSTRSDFYVMDHDGSLEWEGSAYKDGGPYTTPLKLLIQGDKIMFQETLLDYLREVGGEIKYEGGHWPWPWRDSRFTDYSYIFHVCTGKVLMCVGDSRLVDPIKVIQGMDLIGADVGIGNVIFPVMRDTIDKETEEMIKRYGLQPTKAV